MDILYYVKRLYKYFLTASVLFIYNALQTLSAQDSLNTQDLENVVIRANKSSKLETSASGSLVFTPNKDLKQGKSVTELLNAAPMLQYQESDQNGEAALDILGTENTEIYINGRRSFLSKAILLSMLSDQDANNIEKIEIIRNPDASYDVRPGGAIVNIIMAKNNLEGWKGSARANGSHNFRSGFYSGKGSLDLNYKKYRWDMQINANGGQRRRAFFIDTRQIFLSEADYKTESAIRTPQRNRPSGGINLNANYQINAGSSLQISHNLQFRKDNNIRESHSFFSEKIGNIYLQDSAFFSESANTSAQINTATNLHYQYNTDKKGSQFELFFNYNFYQEDTRNITDIYQKGDQDSLEQSWLQVVPRTTHNFYLAGQYKHIFNAKHSLQGGFKTYYTYGVNDVRFSLSQDKIQYKEHPATSNRFFYKEPIFSVFVLYNTLWHPKVQSSIGLKVEQTWQTGTTDRAIATQRGAVQNLYQPWFFLLPTFSVNYNISRTHSLNYAFNASVEKPGINALNPARFITGKNSFSSGSPFLLLSRQYTQEIRYVLLYRYVFFIRSTLITNPIDRLFLVQPEQKSTNFVSANYPLKHTTNIGFSFTQGFFKNRWNTQLSVVARHTYLDLNLDKVFYQTRPYAYKSQGWGAVVNMNQTLLLNRTGNPNKWVLQLNYTQLFNMINAIGAINQGIAIGIGISKTYKNITAALNANDLFRQSAFRTRLIVPGVFHSNTSFYPDRQSVQLTLSYRFGNQKLNTAKQKKITNENARRLQEDSE